MQCLQRRSGSGLLVLVFVLCLMVTIFSVTTMRIGGTLFSGARAKDIAQQAYEYAKDEEELIRAQSGVDTEGRKSVAGTDYELNIIKTKDAQGNYTGTLIESYYKNETQPRASVKVTAIKMSNQNCPIGTVVAWPDATLPKDGGIWLECNGQEISKDFAVLRKLSPSGRTPNYNRALFLRGQGSRSGKLGEVQLDATQKYPVGSFYTYPYQVIAHRGTHAQPWKWGTWNEAEAGPDGVMFKSNRKPHFTTDFQKLGPGVYDPWWNSIYRTQINFSFAERGRVGKETRPLNVAVKFIIKAL